MSYLTADMLSRIGSSRTPVMELVTSREIRKYAFATRQRLAKYLEGREAPPLFYVALFWDVVSLDRLFEFLDSLPTQSRIGCRGVVGFRTRAETGESSDRNQRDGGECGDPSQAPGPGHRYGQLETDLGIHLGRFFATGRVASSGRPDTPPRAPSFTGRG